MQFTVNRKELIRVGSVVVDAVPRKEIESLTFSLREDICEVRGTNTYYDLPTGQLLQWPGDGHPAPESYHSVKPADLDRVITMTSFAVRRQSDARFAINGLLLDFSPDSFSLVGTDCRAMAVATIPATCMGDHSPTRLGTIASLKFSSVLQKCLRTTKSEEVFLSCSPSQITAHADDCLIWGRLIEGRYPDYRLLMDNKQPSRVQFSTSDLLDNINQVGVVLDSTSPIINFHFDPPALLLSAEGCGKARSRMMVAPLDTPASATLLIDRALAADMLAHVRDTQVIASYSSAKWPMFFDPDLPDIKFRYMIAPVAPVIKE
jgi:DNA polymerase III sliding clamp (beta) subunit (PCNA family)